MISRYVQSGICEETQKLFAEMEENDVQPNEFTLATVVKAWANLADLECGYIELSSQVFDKMHARDTVSWTTLISGYVQNGYGEKAL